MENGIATSSATTTTEDINEGVSNDLIDDISTSTATSSEIEMQEVVEIDYDILQEFNNGPVGDTAGSTALTVIIAVILLVIIIFTFLNRR